ncbi:MAG: carotenoid biosynthesis protein [Bacteroidota bacterium]
MNKINRQQTATLISLAFHISGFIAIAIFKSPLFIALTPLNLIICALLIFWTQEIINAAFLTFCLVAYTAGFIAEYIGIHTGILFGDYTYGELLGPKLNGVPWIIGLQWLVTLYCIGISMHMLHKKLASLTPKSEPAETVNRKTFSFSSKGWVFLSTVIDGALLAVLFDYVIEPSAIKLGYWKWTENEIPNSNYYSWWFVSLLILTAFHLLSFKKQNLFAVHLLLIQFMFFLLINTFY